MIALRATLGFYCLASVATWFGLAPLEVCLHSIAMTVLLAVGYRQTRGGM